MKKLIIGTALLCLITTDAYALGNGFQLAGLQINPSISESESHNSNITLSSTNPLSSWITTTMPMLDIFGGSYINYVRLHSYYQNGHYKNASRLNYNDYLVSLSTHNEASSKAALDTNVYYNKGHSQVGQFLSGTAIQATTPYVWRAEGIDARFSYGGVNTVNPALFNPKPPQSTENGHISALLPVNVYNRIVVGGGYKNKRYENNFPTSRLFDLDQSYADGIFYYQLASRIASLVEARYDNFDYIQPGSLYKSRQLSLYGGFSWEFTGKTRGFLKLGMQHKTFANGPSPAPFFSWQAMIEWLLRSYSTVTIDSGTKALEPNTTTGNYTKSNYADVTWSHQWNSRLSHSISFDYAHNSYGGSTRVDDRTRAGISVNYLIVPWLNVGLVYDYENNNSNAQFASYKDNIYLLSLNASL